MIMKIIWEPAGHSGNKFPAEFIMLALVSAHFIALTKVKKQAVWV